MSNPPNNHASASLSGNFFDDLATNPLLEGLPPPPNRVEWATRLRYDPRVEWQGLKQSQMVVAIDQIRRVFAPTALQAEAACALYEMLYTGLISRDPRQAANRQRIYEHGKLKSKPLDTLAWFPTYAAGMTIRGITNQGKSHVVQRVLSFVPQAFVRPKNEECGWKELKQLVHITVPMPSDSSRKGFMLSAFQEIDKALGTTYAEDYGSERISVEIQLVALLTVLSAHRCGLFVVEEAQGENLGTAKFGRQFVLFFLRILNFGIPVLLIGNPLAFEQMDKESQDVGRLSTAGRFMMDPVSHYMHPIWKRDLMPHLWGWTLGIEDEPVEGIDKLVWTYTGGFPGYVARLRKETLRQCHLEGLSRVEESHIHAAYKSVAMTPLHRIIEAFTKKEASLLKEFRDMPVAYFARKWADEAAAVHVARERAKAAAAGAKPTQGLDPSNVAKDSSVDPAAGADATGKDEVVAADTKVGEKAKPARRPPRPKAPKPSDLGDDDLRSPAATKRLAAKLQAAGAA